MSYNYLRTAIKRKNLSLQTVANACDMTKGYLSQLINDKVKMPSAQKLEALHHFLKLEYPIKNKKLVSSLVNSILYILVIFTLFNEQ